MASHGWPVFHDGIGLSRSGAPPFFLLTKKSPDCYAVGLKFHSAHIRATKMEPHGVNLQMGFAPSCTSQADLRILALCSGGKIGALGCMYLRNLVAQLNAWAAHEFPSMTLAFANTNAAWM